MRKLIVLSVIMLLAALPSASKAAIHSHRNPCHKGVQPWLCAKRLSESWYGWTGQQWRDENALVRNESGWNYCAHYPSTTDCGYKGTNACGIPQRDPCPTDWQGNLGKWRRQVFWFLHHIHDRWGNPSVAYYHETHDTY